MLRYKASAQQHIATWPRAVVIPATPLLTPSRFFPERLPTWWSRQPRNANAIHITLATPDPADPMCFALTLPGGAKSLQMRQIFAVQHKSWLVGLRQILARLWTHDRLPFSARTPGPKSLCSSLVRTRHPTRLLPARRFSGRVDLRPDLGVTPHL